MTTPDESTTTDPVEGGDYRYPFLARLFGIDVHARQIADALTNPDEEALAAALAALRDADTTIDKIEPVK